MKKTNKKRIRGGISVRGDTYLLLKDHCERQQISISDFTEHLAIEYLRKQGEATPVDPVQEMPVEKKRGVVIIETNPNRIRW